ncbi:MAG: hypothetical protein WBO17_08140 [Sphingorhabdus sp.]
MKFRLISLFPLLALGACTEEPNSQAVDSAVTELTQDEVKAKQRAIEEAAEKATKSIEEEAKADTEFAAPKDSDNVSGKLPEGSNQAK